MSNRKMAELAGRTQANKALHQAHVLSAEEVEASFNSLPTTIAPQ
jgi:hypothetical protein